MPVNAVASKTVVAHRGASAYAPEHTRPAYELAISQGADYVEQDLAVTLDGELICLHDDSLERTTNVAELFPDRFTTDPTTGAKHWMAADFTLDEIKRLDAGGWFNPTFAGERLLTFSEAIEVVGGRAGLYPELKSPALYRGRAVDMVGLVAAELGRAGLDAPGRNRPSVIMQSFDPEALRELSRVLPHVPRVFLLELPDAEPWLSAEGMREIPAFANGIAPHKEILEARPALVGRAHELGLTVTPYTFRSRNTGRFESVAAEMQYFLYALGVDALFTDNPDQFPRTGPAA